MKKTVVLILSLFTFLVIPEKIWAGNTPCAATAISNSMTDFVQFSNAGTSNSGIPAPACGNFVTADFWFSFIAPASGDAYIATLAEGLQDAAMAIYEGACANPSEIICVEDDLCGNTDMPITSFTNLVPGQTYYIRIWAESGPPTGTFWIRVSDGPISFPDFITNGTANYIDEECIQLTTTGPGQTGCVWYPNLIDFTLAFNHSMVLNFGTNDAGADGICLVYQVNGTSECGATGENIAIGGVPNTFIVEFDTYQNGNLGDPAQDHTSVNINGNMNHSGSLAGPVILNGGNIENGQDFIVDFTWDPVTMTYEVFFDGASMMTGVFDIVANCFGGNPMAFWGYTASTGGATNNQSVCPGTPNYPHGIEMEEEAEICEGESLFVGGGNQTTSGMYVDVFVSGSGCDSIVYTDLTVIPTTEYDTTAVVCVNECFSINGTQYCTDGDHEQTVSSAAGCDSIISLNLTILDPFAGAIPPQQILTCQITEVTIDGTPSTSGPGVTYFWSGPNGFTSNEQSPTVTEGGTYVLFVEETLDGVTCQSQVFTVEVLQDITPPVVNAGPDMTINCDANSTFLDGSGSSPDASMVYSWTGPGGFTSNEVNPEVFLGGEYTLIIINSFNNCFESDVVEVFVDGVLPSANAEGGMLNCSIDSIQIFGTSDDPNASFEWMGPNGFISNDQSPFVFENGIYSLIVSNVSGCASGDTALVTIDLSAPDLSIQADILDCDADPNFVYGNTTVSGSMYNWSGPNGYISDLQDAPVTQPGIYILTVTGPNGCTNIDSILVESNAEIPDVSIQNDTLDCNVTTIDLFAENDSIDLDYNWEGPNGFESNEQNPTISEAGNYQLTVTASNGCSNLANIVIESDTSTPSIELFGNNLNCENSSSLLDIPPPDSIFSYEWNGPNNFESDEAAVTISDVGLYEITVTGENGCTSTTELMIEGDFVEPNVEAEGDTLNCLAGFALLSASSTTPNVNFTWLNENQETISLEESTMTTQAGIYTIIVTASNGCTSFLEVEILENDAVPDLSTLGDTINCFSNEFNIVAESNTDDVIYTWEGPNSFQSNNPNPMILDAGTYTVTVTAQNGCIATQEVDVVLDDAIPQLMLENDTITCETNSIILELIHTGSGNIFNWAGPNGFDSNDENPSISESGLYSVTVTSDNGCSSVIQSMIEADENIPVISTSFDSIINCLDGIASVSAIGQDPSYTYLWNGPNNFETNDADFQTVVAGDYFLTVTSDNGCKTFTQITILDDSVYPVLALTNDTLTCTKTSLNLNAVIDDIEADILWSGPDGFISFEISPLITEPGSYAIAAISLNGCGVTGEIEIYSDTEIPEGNLSGGTLTCTNTEINIGSLPNDPSYLFSWEHESGETYFDAEILINTGGIYSLTITDSTNGCTEEFSIDIEQLIAPNEMQFQAIQPNCDGDLGSLTISDVDGGQMPFQYSIDGGLTFQSSNIFTGLPADYYDILILDGNNCPIDSFTELFDPEEILLEAIDLHAITYGDSVQLELTTNVDPLEIDTIIWDPQEFLNCSNCLDPYAFPLGTTTFTAQVIDINGCTESTSITVSVVLKDLYIPNIFSPNNDGFNDIFTVFGDLNQIEIVSEFAIYDRWGNQVFYLSDFIPDGSDQSWDGNFNGKPAVTGVYAYQFIVRFKNGTQKAYAGDITLIR